MGDLCVTTSANLQNGCLWVCTDSVPGDARDSCAHVEALYQQRQHPVLSPAC